MRESIDEILLIFGISTSYLLLLLVTKLEYFSLVGSLVILVITAMYYGITFFRTSQPYKKFIYFLILMVCTIGYFALVYKAFGIIDTSNSEIIKPDWLNSMYFSVVTWTTLGYGDFKPTEQLKLWVMAEAMMGYIFMGLIVGKVMYLAQRSS